MTNTRQAKMMTAALTTLTAASSAHSTEAPFNNQPTIRFSAPKGFVPHQAPTQHIQNPSFAQNGRNSPAYNGPKKFR